MQRGKINGDLLFPQAEEATDANHYGSDVSIAVDDEVINLSKVVGVGVSSVVNRLIDDFRRQLIGIDPRVAR